MGRNTLGTVETDTDELKVGDIIRINNIPPPFNQMWMKVSEKNGKSYRLEFFSYVK